MCKQEVIPMGEKVWYKEVREGKERRNQLETEEKEGIWLGHARSSNEALIGTREGVVKAHTVRRQTEETRWDGQFIKEMEATPRQPIPSKDGHEVPTKVHFDPVLEE